MVHELEVMSKWVTEPESIDSAFPSASSSAFEYLWLCCLRIYLNPYSPGPSRLSSQVMVAGHRFNLTLSPKFKTSFCPQNFKPYFQEGRMLKTAAWSLLCSRRPCLASDSVVGWAVFEECVEGSEVLYHRDIHPLQPAVAVPVLGRRRSVC